MLHNHEQLLSRPTKRQRKEQPPSWLENHSLACVAAPNGEAIRTNVVSTDDKFMFLDRFEKEIIQPFFGDVAATTEHKKNKNRNRKIKSKQIKKQTFVETATQQGNHLQRNIAKRRIVVGTNQCTRILEKLQTGDSAENKRPSLIVMARDIYPPTILSHIPVMARKRTGDDDKPKADADIPILLLAGKASSELGKLFGTKHVSIILFLQENSDRKGRGGVGGGEEEEGSSSETEVDTAINSFLGFIKRALL